jgi:hypothetical protein
LQAGHDRSGGSQLQRGHPAAVGQRGAGQRADDPIDGEARALLELFHRRLDRDSFADSKNA